MCDISGSIGEKFIIKCYGCGRTWQQIKEWSFYSEDERLKIMKDLKKPVFDDI